MAKIFDSSNVKQDGLLDAMGKLRVGQYAQSLKLKDASGKLLPKERISAYRVEGETLFVTLMGIEIKESDCMYPIR